MTTSTTPQATTASSLNLGGLTVSCDFAPYNYPDSRQPNTVFFDYEGDGTKVVTIVIDKKGQVQWAQYGGDPFTDLDFLLSAIRRAN